MKLGTKVGLSPDHTVLDGDLASPTERGTAAPTFRPMSTVAKRSPISATAELLFLCLSGVDGRLAARWITMQKVADSGSDL